MAAQLLPPTSSSLPPLGGGLLAAYRLAWWASLAVAVAVVAMSWFDASTPLAIWCLRLVKSIVLVGVSVVLFRRRDRDPVAAMLALCFLLWIISSSVDFATATGLPALLDRCRFLLFALALLIFPDGEWFPSWTRQVAVAIVITFLVGIAESTGVLPSSAYLPLAIGCVLLAIAALIASYRRRANSVRKQQLKWMALGLVAGVSLILSARAAAALTAGMDMPWVGSVLLEALFQTGIVGIALGLLTSIIRYRLYDAEAAISRSALYAGLTLTLVATFAACEALIELVSQNYLGAGFGNVSGAVAAAVVAVLLTPLHGKISCWAEHHFQRDLMVLKKQLPDLLVGLSAGASVGRLGAAIMPHIEGAIHATRMALVFDSKLVAVHGISSASAKRLMRERPTPTSAQLLDRDDENPFPLRMVLRCPLGTVRGWLLIGPRPDGSFYGKDDMDALAEIAPPLQRTLILVAEREAEVARLRRHFGELQRSISVIGERLGKLERA